jgi:thiol:disulfide interchange protein
VCRKECIPEEGDFTLKLPVRGSTALHRQAFEQAFAAQPRPVLQDGGGVIPRSTVTIQDKAIELRVQGLPVEARGKTLEFFPETAEVIETAGAWTQAWNGAVWTARVPLSPQRSASPQPMPVVLAAGGQGWRAELQVVAPGRRGARRRLAGAAGGAARQRRQRAAAQGPGIGFFAALLGALLGGLVLNLMPCVFPMLAIKVVGFARMPTTGAATAWPGLAYTAGVVVSFLALGALMLGLRAAGEQLGWGFQLQSPLWSRRWRRCSRSSR